MTYRVIITARANANTIAAFRWKTRHLTRVAEHWLTGLDRAIAALKRSSERHPITEVESERAGFTLREMLHVKKPGT